MSIASFFCHLFFSFSWLASHGLAFQSGKHWALTSLLCRLCCGEKSRTSAGALFTSQFIFCELDLERRKSNCILLSVYYLETDSKVKQWAMKPIETLVFNWIVKHLTMNQLESKTDRLSWNMLKTKPQWTIIIQWTKTCRSWCWTQPFSTLHRSTKRILLRLWCLRSSKLESCKLTWE